MAKLTKAEAKAHAAACDLLRKDRLTDDEREFVLTNWHEGATNINSAAGAFFTPLGLALDLTIEVSGCRRIIDLCAGIGCLALACHWRNGWGDPPREIVCVEKNPAYVEVGRKILPEATWICADVFDVPSLGLGRFDAAISNPPFGATPRDRKAPRYSGRAFEFHVIDIAAGLAEQGAFIIPQPSAPFRFSGAPCFERCEGSAYRGFSEATGVSLEPGCGIDCAYHADGWRGVKPTVEVVTADFTGGQ
jgi:hypothetical protein